MSAPCSIALGIHFKVSAPRTLTAEGQHIVAARQAQPGAFEALVRRHQTTIYNFCWRMLGQADDAADVAQDVFVQLYSHLDRVDEFEPLAPWLFRVARNRCIDVIRRRRTVPFDADDELQEPIDDDPLPDEVVERADIQRVLSEAIAALPTRYAEVVALRYAADRSFAEIGAILDVDEGAARVRFHRAKALLREHLRQTLRETEP
jgi:RNA polymerase sigma-70 factor (ECF subfamily)